MILHIKSVKYFLPICNISSDSIEKAPWFRSSPFYLWHGNYFIILHKILLGLVYLKTSSGIGFNGLWCCWKKWGNSGKYEKNLNLSAPGGPYTPWSLEIHCKYLCKSIKHLIIWLLSNIHPVLCMPCQPTRLPQFTSRKCILVNTGIQKLIGFI